MFTKREKPETEQLEQAEHGSNTGGYMAELDQWLIESIFRPIEQAIGAGDTKELYLAFDECSKLIKRKVLASYHNGLKAKTPTNPKTYGQQIYRRNEAARYTDALCAGEQRRSDHLFGVEFVPVPVSLVRVRVRTRSKRRCSVFRIRGRRL